MSDITRYDEVAYTKVRAVEALHTQKLGAGTVSLYTQDLVLQSLTIPFPGEGGILLACS